MNVYPLNIYYESACPLCNAEMTNLMRRDTAGLLRFTDVSAPGFVPQLGAVTKEDLLGVIHAQRADGVVINGVEVFDLAYSAIGVHWFGRMIRRPVVRAIAERSYRLLAHVRHQIPAPVVKLLLATVLRHAAETSAATRCDRETGCRS